MTRALLLASLIATLACGDDDTSPADAGTDIGDLPDGGRPDNGVRYDDFFSGECTRSCGADQFLTGCVCVDAPEPAAEFSTNRVGCSQLTSEGAVRNPEDDFCVEGAVDEAPNLGCMMPGSYRTVGTSEMVTMYGVVDVFGNGGDADAITVEVYAEGADGALGEMLGTAIADIGDPCSETEIQYENDLPTDERQLGFYAIPNIPSETPLIVKTSGAPSFWRSIYTYNVVATNDEVESDPPPGDACETLRTGAAFDGVPRYEFRARILSDSDWTSIPLTAGLTEGVRATSGVVAGEVHDCDDVRLEFAQAATAPRAEVLTFFNDNPDNPLPSLGRTEGTSLLGLYAALDIPEGPVDVSAVGSVGGEVVSLGWYRARIFAGAVTTVTLRGLRAHQVPVEE